MTDTTEAADPSGKGWDPTHGMTSEERMGYEMIRTLEGQLVTDDTFKEHKRILELNLKSLRYQLRATYAVIAVLTVLVGGLAVAAVLASHHASEIAAHNRFETRCNQLILFSIAQRELAPEGAQIGCDMRPAQVLIDRATARDKALGLPTAGPTLRPPNPSQSPR